ncbi:M20/M25/M40 family metallo-hydrolase [Clostridium magnum]|uniref:Succinyl-diaminopimelate desuccinylase n=1 Tax=Clostridium magnum DSM 2767 TaxID=1121326 RepID=A0A162S3W2_9CLOT|nr:M20/M25/M40 family metallo-hydrolase [Clostridium magnum]KZL90739.1 succinyl-diaminopimelate desuccinylase [Clostridium magnum DSM 2767]SHJ34091.1 Arginine utilization protein RocB [Clostridium magnum DSM 2767]
MSLQNNIYSTLKQLVAVPSVTGTEGENIICEKIYDVLSGIPYFKKNQKNYGLSTIDQDPLERKFIWAIVNGKEESKDTLILTGHIDVVEADGFGHLEPIAFDLEECTKRITELNLDEEALRDFLSGEWIFGRGTADMKAGIATNIEIIRELSENRNFKGNLLFLGVPGEESNSEGMIASVPFLLDLQEKEGYNYVGAIVSECSIPKSEGEKFKRIYIGTVGKIMPLFFCVGKETHVGESLKGLNPNLLVSEINRILEANPDFCDKVNDKITPPPMVLKQTDLKEIYSVQSPLFAISYYNLLTLNKSEEELISELKDLAFKAFSNILSDIKEKRERFLESCCEEAQYIEVEPYVMTYKDLISKVKEKEKNFEDYIREKVKNWEKEKLDSQTISINIVKETYEKYENKRPMIIVSFIPPYYPHKHLDGEDEKSRRFMDVIEKTIQYAKENFDETIIKDDFFMGISDLSYTGINGKQDLDNWASNIVGYGINYDLNLEALSKLNIPGIVFGGEGKDFHKSTERLNVPYSLKVVPELYKYIIHYILR